MSAKTNLREDEFGGTAHKRVEKPSFLSLPHWSAKISHQRFSWSQVVLDRSSSWEMRLLATNWIWLDSEDQQSWIRPFPGNYLAVMWILKRNLTLLRYVHHFHGMESLSKLLALAFGMYFSPLPIFEPELLSWPPCFFPNLIIRQARCYR